MPEMPCSRSPQSPVRKAGRTGTPPATEAPNSSWHPLLAASWRRSGPWRAISCLLAVTTDLPDSRALWTICWAGFNPPMSSTIMSTSEFKTESMSSVQTTSLGTQGCFLRSTLRFEICVRRRPLSRPSHKIFAASRPTVPKPISATRQAGDSFAPPLPASLAAVLELTFTGFPAIRKLFPYHTCERALTGTAKPKYPLVTDQGGTVSPAILAFSSQIQAVSADSNPFPDRSTPSVISLWRLPVCDSQLGQVDSNSRPQISR